MYILKMLRAVLRFLKTCRFLNGMQVSSLSKISPAYHKEKAITGQSLYRHVTPDGKLRPDGEKLFNRKRTPASRKGL